MKTILLIEDDRALNSGLTYDLEMEQYRVYPAFTLADTEGIGIGLYLAREIVMKQRGFIEVRSRAGEGTEFYVNLSVERN